ncbi:MAG: amidohydrolase family protein [Candidatus Latescibacterota bacterium]|nr:amidohydrolase family protein [Candidatus Latescibacterota bacterium]
MTVIDTHAHVYASAKQAHRFPTVENPYLPPPDKGTMEHLSAERERWDVERVVLIQTFTAYARDNALLADCAREHRDWTVGVCNLDPVDPQSPERFRELVEQHNVRGLRLEAPAEGDFYNSGSVEIMRTAREIGAVICAHIHRPHFLGLDQLLAEFPDVDVVLDHCAYPDVSEGSEGPTPQAVVALARHSRLHVKLTFLVTSSAQDYPFSDTHAIAHRIIDAYGVERCMWGSDFPCELWLKKATYGEHIAVIAEELGLAAEQLAQILSETARRVWFFDK